MSEKPSTARAVTDVDVGSDALLARFLLRILDLGNHHELCCLVDPVRKNEAIYKNMLDLMTSGIDEKIVTFNESKSRQLIGSIYHFSLSPLRERQNKLCG
jgi:hypothetical protein